MTKISRRNVLAGMASVPMLAAPAFVRAQAPLKVGYVYLSPVEDFGWSYAHERSRLAVEAAFGDRVQTTAVDNVPEGSGAEVAIAQLAREGHGLIFTTSFGHMNSTVKVASQFPNVYFEHCTGFQRTANVSTYNARFYEGRAVLGAMMARLSKTGIGGYIGGQPIPEVYAGINATLQAARSIDPDFKLKLIWVNSWFDPEREAEAAHALMDMGADILTQHTDSVEPLKAAESRGKFGFGQASDMSKFAPNAHLTSLVYNWAPYCISRVQAVLDGTWATKDTSLGIVDNGVQLAPFGPKVSPGVRITANSVRDEIADGRLDPFAGPIRDQHGGLRVPGGQTVSYAQILEMDWLAQGVEG